MATTIIYEEVVEEGDQEYFHRSLRDWALGRAPWSDEAEQRGEEEHRQQSHREEEEQQQQFWPALMETTWAEARSRLQTECAVCLKDFEAEDRVSKMPCSHCFHQGCIFEWLRVSCVCPFCRCALTTA